jgi:hypothetical protein
VPQPRVHGVDVRGEHEQVGPKPDRQQRRREVLVDDRLDAGMPAVDADQSD